MGLTDLMDKGWIFTYAPHKAGGNVCYLQTATHYLSCRCQAGFELAALAKLSGMAR